MKAATVVLELFGIGHRSEVIDRALEEREQARKPALAVNAELRHRIAAKMGLESDRGDHQSG